MNYEWFSETFTRGFGVLVVIGSSLLPIPPASITA